MARKSLLIPTIAATALATSTNNSPLHLHQTEDVSNLPPSRRRRRPRLLTSELSKSSNISVSNDISLILEISPLLPQISSSTLEEELEFIPRIINGNAASPNRYPYTASLIDSTNRHVCGGTLIAPDIILTAGHCSGFFDMVQIDRYDVTSDDGEDTDYDYLLVEEHYPHPNYANVIQSDFALAKLYGRSDKPLVRLNTDGDSPVDDEYLTVMGWGVTVEGVSSTQSDVLREVEVQYMSNEECDSSSGSYNGDFVTYDGYIESNMLCAWSSNKDACQGDSGGPLIRKGSDTDDDVQVGVVSWGLGCAMQTFPGVYSRISEEYDWIRSSVCEISRYPPSSFGCITTSEAEFGVKEEVTFAMELDGYGYDTSWVLEAFDRGNYIEGTSFVPFGTYDANDDLAVESMKLTPYQSYQLTIMDRSGAGSYRSESRYRLCYGAVSASDCLNGAATIICGGNGIISSTRTVTCDVEAPSPSPTVIQLGLPVPVPILGGRLPTFAPFFVPLFFETRQPLQRDSESLSPTPFLTTMTPTLSLKPDTQEPTQESQPPTKTPTPTSIPTKTPTPTSMKASIEAEETRDSTITNAEAAVPSSASHTSLRYPSIVCIAVAIFFL